MTQLYVGNLSEDCDEKTIRLLFGRYGVVREVLMKDGYAFTEMDTALQAEQAMRVLNGTDILGYTVIVEPSHPRRLSRSSSDSTEFPLRILVPSVMVGAIIGEDGATIKGIKQLTKARSVDVHRRENVGSVEKAITIIGTPEACTEACYQIMKIMQNELLMPSDLLENGKHHHFEPLPVVPLKILAHNELVSRVIGKDGKSLKHIMTKSGTKITISNFKDLAAYNMERTVTIVGTIDNCKKAESLISAKLRASYASDMNQFMQTPVPGGVESNKSPPHGSLTTKFPPISLLQAQSLPPTPTAVRTFTDFSQEHTRLTLLHGSTGALEVNGLGGFYGQVNKQEAFNPGLSGNFRAIFESGVDGVYPPKQSGFVYPERDPLHSGEPGNGVEDDPNDVFTNMTIHEPYPSAVYPQGRSYRSSAPLQHGNNLWNSNGPMGMRNGYGGYVYHNPAHWGALPPNNMPRSQSVHGSVPSIIWSPTFTSPPESEVSSYHDSDESQSFNGFSPVYSPVSGNFYEAISSTISSGTSLVAMTTAASSCKWCVTSPCSVIVRSVCVCVCVCEQYRFFFLLLFIYSLSHNEA